MEWIKTAYAANLPNLAGLLRWLAILAHFCRQFKGLNRLADFAQYRSSI
jgi:hypothetical protein